MNRIFSFLEHFGLPAMLLFIFLEYACFPVSSEIVLPFCGALASLKEMSYFSVTICSAVAGLLGTLLCYMIGFFGGPPFLRRLGRRFPSLHKGIEQSFQRFKRYGTALVLFGRFIPLCRTYLGFAAGALHQPLKLFLPFSFLGILGWNSLLIGLGFLLKDNWPKVTTWYTRYKNILVPALLLFFFISLLLKFRKKNTLFVQESNHDTLT